MQRTITVWQLALALPLLILVAPRPGAAEEGELLWSYDTKG